MTAMRLLISGRVQGVFYRASTRRTAEGLGLTGWVRNLPGSRVEVFAQGDDASLDDLVTWCHHGPPAAIVDSVDRASADPEPGLQHFEVRY